MVTQVVGITRTTGNPIKGGEQRWQKFLKEPNHI